MSILDELKKMTRPYDDDEDMMDDEVDVDEGYSDQPAYQQPYQQAPVQQQPYQQAPVQQPQQTAYTQPDPVQQPQQPMDDLFGTVNTVPASDMAKYRVMLIQPEQFDCATEIADSLIKGDAIVLNCEQTDALVTRRVVDFLSGVAYALKGDIKKAAHQVYIIAPSDVGVDSGSEDAEPEE